MSHTAPDPRRLARPHPLNGGHGFGHVTPGPALKQCLHQNTGRGNAPLQQVSRFNKSHPPPAGDRLVGKHQHLVEPVDEAVVEHVEVRNRARIDVNSSAHVST